MGTILSNKVQFLVHSINLSIRICYADSFSTFANYVKLTTQSQQTLFSISMSLLLYRHLDNKKKKKIFTRVMNTISHELMFNASSACQCNKINLVKYRVAYTGPIGYQGLKPALALATCSNRSELNHI